MFFFYNISIGLLTILFSPFLFFKIVTKKKYRTGFKQRLGFLPSDLRKKLQGKRPIWLHAVSVGEVNASLPLIKGIKERYPDIEMIVSTITATGNRTARDKIRETENIIFFPFDYSGIVRRVVEEIHPRLFITMETEIWPNFLRILSGKDIPALILNGRISNRSFGRYRMVRVFMKKVLSCISFFGMQTGKDAERIIQIGAEKDRVRVIGNIKFDAPLPVSGKEEDLRVSLGLANSEGIMIAGSTHPGEEEKILAVYHRIKREYPDFVLIIAPRHIERVKEIEELIKREGFMPRRRTSSGYRPSASSRQNDSVLILDTFGELSGLYGISTLIFVGGSFVPGIGGHNVLEPAVYKKPVFYGPFMDNFSEIADAMREKGGGIQVRDEDDFVSKAEEILTNRERYRELGEKSYATVRENQGSLYQCLEAVKEFIK
jgi:3-deoxy-D-manno-octulosonic-acid transferase